MTPAERRARRLLAAYPWRVRVEQGDEIVGTTLDAMAPGAERLPWRDQLDLVRGGLRVRRRRRPPWPVRLAYSFGLRLDARWIWWVFDELERPDYVRSKRRRLLVWWFVAMSALAVLLRDPLAILYGIGGVAGALATVPRERARRRARHGLAPGGSDPRIVWIERARPAVVPNLSAGTVAIAVGGAAMAGAGATVLASAHPAPGSAPGRGAAMLEVTVHPAATGALGSFVLVGAVVAVVGLAPWLRPVWRSRGALPTAPVARRATTVVAVLGAVLALGVTAGPALPVLWRWLPGPYGQVAALVLVAAAGLVLFGLVVGAVGWRRGAPVGAWELAPRLAPRTVVEPTPTWQLAPRGEDAAQG